MFLNERKGADRRLRRDGLNHVVNGRAGGQRGDESLHLDARRGFGSGACLDGEAVLGEMDDDVDLREVDLMTERYQVGCLFGGENAGDARGGRDLALDAGVDKSTATLADDHTATNQSLARCFRLGGDVDHLSFGFGVQMREVTHVIVSPSRQSCGMWRRVDGRGFLNRALWVLTRRGAALVTR